MSHVFQSIAPPLALFLSNGVGVIAITLALAFSVVAYLMFRTISKGIGVFFVGIVLALVWSVVVRQAQLESEVNQTNYDASILWGYIVTLIVIVVGLAIAAVIEWELPLLLQNKRSARQK